MKLNEKIAQIEQQIEQLQILKQELKGLLSGKETHFPHLKATICPIIEQTNP